MLLSKSDFKVARTCGTKLYYRKLGYPSVLAGDPYLEFLADGGYMVEAIAKLRYPDGVEIVAESAEEGFAKTMQVLAQEDVTLFGATLIYGRLMAQVDILEKRGNVFRLIEVKAKTVEVKAEAIHEVTRNNTNNKLTGNGNRSPFIYKKSDEVLADWTPYVEDVAYQMHILHNIFPEAQVIPYLCVVDKSQTSTSETSFENFHIKPRPKDREGSYRKPEISFTGNAEALRNQSFVQTIDVTAEVEKVLPEVRSEAARFAESLSGDQPRRLEPVLGVICKKCEYRQTEVCRTEGELDGFGDCWGELADPSPHLLDLYRVGRLGTEVINEMIARKKVGLTDVAQEDLRGKIGERQAIQLEWTLKNQEFIDPQLPKLLEKCKYPLHFLDFEATRLAVPYHAGMHPYGLVAFQWSCHTLWEPGGELDHQKWINVDDAYPNFEFARQLKEVIELDSTVFVWSAFERTVLKDIRERISWYKGDETLAPWLDAMIDESGPIVDLYELAKRFYFHPEMGGSVSIKKVLPAVWYNDPVVRGHRWFAEYLEAKDGQPLDPYKTLKPLAFDLDGPADPEDAVQEGTAAIRTYQEMMFGARKSEPVFRETMKQRLLNYCKLDTAAMVMIWMHWMGGELIGQNR